MASMCPKCHQLIDEESVCCADVKYAWKCKSCGKLSTGFVIPYGRCFLCGGENEISKGYSGMQPELVAIASEAVRYEVDMYCFYRLSMNRTSDPTAQSGSQRAVSQRGRSPRIARGKVPPASGSRPAKSAGAERADRFQLDISGH